MTMNKNPTPAAASLPAPFLLYTLHPNITLDKTLILLKNIRRFLILKYNIFFPKISKFHILAKFVILCGSLIINEFNLRFRGDMLLAFFFCRALCDKKMQTVNLSAPNIKEKLYFTGWSPFTYLDMPCLAK
nr:MAG TPA: hypothetical protein [Caudoviricetes sp.]